MDPHTLPGCDHLCRPLWPPQQNSFMWIFLLVLFLSFYSRIYMYASNVPQWVLGTHTEHGQAQDITVTAPLPAKNASLSLRCSNFAKFPSDIHRSLCPCAPEENNQGLHWISWSDQRWLSVACPHSPVLKQTPKAFIESSPSDIAPWWLSTHYQDFP